MDSNGVKDDVLACNKSVLQMDAIDSTGLVIPISVWTRRVPSSDTPRCIVVMEPVERTTASVTFDSTVSYHLFVC